MRDVLKFVAAFYGVLLLGGVLAYGLVGGAPASVGYDAMASEPEFARAVAAGKMIQVSPPVYDNEGRPFGTSEAETEAEFVTEPPVMEDAYEPLGFDETVWSSPTDPSYRRTAIVTERVPTSFDDKLFAVVDGNERFKAPLDGTLFATVGEAATSAYIRTANAYQLAPEENPYRLQRSMEVWAEKPLSWDQKFAGIVGESLGRSIAERSNRIAALDRESHGIRVVQSPLE